MDTIITERQPTVALLRLMAWLSPAFPIGAFSYSGGLEQAVHDGTVADATGLRDWLEALLRDGGFWNDAVLLAEAYRAAGDEGRLAAVAELAAALCGSGERYRESLQQGEAFLTAAAAWPHPALATLGSSTAYPVAVGAVAGAHATGLEASAAAYLHAVVSNLASVAIRCGVIGQRDGVAVLAAIEPLLARIAARAACSMLDDLGSATVLADVASLRHETLEPRLFRS
ncbi:urease accessory protein UreF [Rhizobium sp. TRM95111]|uniref:urease accessory protein UreF n=1 Tax=Rhizobium alarense TaxID=2846851 RepID=UPI001F1AD337|nr:urease accessory UreF family protein [Rhizobium alarense]MCF3641451.1 urease accessory protein UreF [Rhizobium alarense]